MQCRNLMRVLPGVVLFATCTVAAAPASAQRKGRTLGAGFAKQRENGGPPRTAEVNSRPNGQTAPKDGKALGATRPAGEPARPAARTTSSTAPPTAARRARPIVREERRAIAQRAVVEERKSVRDAAQRKVSAARAAISEAESRVSSTSRALSNAQQRRSSAVREVEELESGIESAERKLVSTRKDAGDAVRRANAVGKKRGFLAQVLGALTFGLAVDKKVDQRLQDEARTLIAEVERLEAAIPKARARLTAARDQVTSAGREVARARENDAAAREQLEVVVRAGKKVSGEADAAERALGQATAALEVAEADATRAVDRYMRRRVLRDQHRERLLAQSDPAAVRASVARNREAARRFQVTSFIEPKPGEYSQDAMALVPEEGVFAISDGVSNSEFPGEFARSLVRAYTARRPGTPEEFTEVVSEAQAAWDAETADRIAAAKKNYYARNVKWVAGATFLGARLTGTGKRQRLELMGIGDSNLFVVRNGAIAKAWPQETSSQFSNEVQGVKSNGPLKAKIPTTTVPVEPGDEVFLATDALSAWILAEAEAGRDPFPALRGIKSQRQMNEFVERARDKKLPGRGQMNEDDTALVRFVIPTTTATKATR